MGHEIEERIKRGGRIRIQERVPQSRLAYHTYRQIPPLVPGITETASQFQVLKYSTKFSHLTPEPNVKETIPVGELFILGPVSLMPRNKTPLVTGTGTPLITKVASATVNGLNGFEIGTLMPEGLKPTLVPGILNGSGTNGTAARDASKNERTYLKSSKHLQVFVT